MTRRRADGLLLAALLALAVAPATGDVEPLPDLAEMEPAVAHALELARDAALTEPELAGAHGRYAATAHAHGLLAVARGGYREAMRLSPREFRWSYLYALAVDADGGTADEIGRAYRAATTLRGDYAPLHLRHGRALARHGLLTEARAVLERTLEHMPEMALAQRAAGQIALSLGDLPAAESHLRRAVELRPDDGAAFGALARVFMQLEQVDEAERAARRARWLSPVEAFADPVYESEVRALGVSSRHLYSRAQRRLDRGELDRAEEALEVLRARRADDADVWFLLAMLAGHRSQAEPARVHLQHALALNPNHVRANVELARLLSALGRPDEALQHYRKALETTPGDPGLLAATAHLLATSGDVPAAIELFERLLEISPEEPALHVNLGTAHAVVGNGDKAVAHFTKALRLRPGDAEVHHRLGMALQQMGREDDAKAHFDAWQSLRSPSTPAESPVDERAEFEQIARSLLDSSNRYLGRRRVTALEQSLTDESLQGERRVRTRMKLTRGLLEAGEVERAVAEIEATIDSAKDADGALWYDLQRMRGLAYMRQAEVQNCVLRHNRDCCIFPLEGGGRHTEKGPAQAARRSFEGILERRPDDLAVRWLLNVMAMALGEYPKGVEERHRLPAESFLSEHDVGRFPDIAPELGLDTFNLCGGAVVDDFDGDGLLDIVTSTYDPEGSLTFYRNDGRGAFEDRSAASRLDRQFGGLNTLSADYDGDGDADLLVLRGAWLFDDGKIRNSLVRNNGDGTFTDVTHTAGLDRPAFPTQTAAWGDFDNDGDLDLYVCNESRKYDPAQPADFPSQLYSNNGDGTFADVARKAGVTNDRYCKGTAAGDYDDDGDLDLYVSNVSDNRLYRNDGDGTFTDVAEQAGVIEPRGRSFATWFFDYDNDGRLDLFVAGYDTDIADLAAESLARKHDAEPPRLYRNLGNGRFADVTSQAGLNHPYLPMGANFGDLDNDGFLDIYLATGDPSFESLMPNVMLRNDAGRKFQDVTRSGGFGHLQKGHGVAFGDLDNDGDQDIYHQLGGFFPGDRFHNALFANPGHGNRSFWLELVGTRSNRAGYGARVTVVVDSAQGERRIHRAVGSTSSFGGSPRRQEIGIGKAERIKRLEIVWPASGIRQAFEDLPAGLLLRVTEGRDTVEQSSPPRVRF